MAFTLSGAVCIPSEEFWTWIYDTKPEIAELDQMIDPKSLILHSLDGMLTMLTAGRTLYEIDTVDFWRFVSDYHPSFAPAESCFGVPRFDESKLTLIIPFFATTSNIQHAQHPDKERIDSGWKVYRERAPLVRQEYWFDK